MKNTTPVRDNTLVSKKLRKSLRRSRAMNLETLEIRDLLAANTLDIVDNLDIDTVGGTRDLQLEVDPTSGSGIVALRIHGTSGSLNPDVPLVFIQDADRNNPANHIPLISAMADVNGTTDSYVLFEVAPGDKFTIQVGGSSGTGGFTAEVMLFGSTDSIATVTEYEYMQAVAAELQGRGVGNHNTAAYFMATYGINFNESQYNVAFDSNMNGKVDGFEVGYVQKNMQGGGTIIVDLIGDNEAPEVEAAVVVDTGTSATDNITSDTTGISGTVTDFSRIVSAVVSIQGGSGSIDLANTVSPPTISALTQTDSEITFTLSTADLDALLASGSVVDGGTFTLLITTEDELGNVSVTPFSLDFNFDTTAPAQPVAPDLVASSDSGASDTDNITNDSTPTITVTTEPGASVGFYFDNILRATVVADAAGVATLTPTVGIVQGTYIVTVRSTDVAGNESVVSNGLTITIDNLDPTPFSNLDLTNDSGIDDNLTDQAIATFSGQTEENVLVEILQDGNVLASTTADGTGAFSFSAADNLTLDLGVNSFVFRATDTAGNTTTEAFVVYRNTLPTIPPNQNLYVEENSTQGTSLSNVSATDGDDGNETLTFEIVSIDGVTYDGSLFVINPTTGEVTVAANADLDFEDPANGDHQFNLEIRVTDSYGNGTGNGSLSVTQLVVVNVTDVNEAPVISNTVDEYEIPESSAPGTVVVDIDATDVDAADTVLAYSLSGADANLFEIDSDGVITVKAGAVLDYETDNSFDVTVTVTDQGGPEGAGFELTDTFDITITLGDVNEAPVITSGNSFSVDENTEDDVVFGTVTATDEDADDTSLNYTIIGGTGQAYFAIDPATGEISVLDNSILDYESGVTSYTLEIQVYDQVVSPETGTVMTATQIVTVNINDINDAPTTTLTGTFEIPEDAQVGDVVTTDGSTDADLNAFFADEDAGQTLSYQIVGGDPNNYFAIVSDGNGGFNIVVNQLGGFDEETPALSSYTLMIEATDTGNPARTVTGTVTVDVTNVNELPAANTVDLGSVRYNSVDEAGEVGSVVKTIGLVDPDVGGTLSYEDFSANSYFTVNEFGQVVLTNEIPSGVLVNDELEVTLNNVVVTDNDGAFKTITVTFKVVVNSPPEFVANSPAEGTVITVNENLPDGGANNLGVGDVIDEDLDILATDLEGDNPLVYTVEPNASFTSPELAALFNVALADDADMVNGEYTLVLANADNLRFNYVNSFGASNGTFDVDLVVRDALGGEVRRAITITVVNLNDTPTFSDPASPVSVDELVQHADDNDNNIQAGEVVYNLNNSFADADNTTAQVNYLTYTLANTPGSEAFEIVGNQLVIKDPTLLDYEALQVNGDAEITLTIEATDPGGKSVSDNITITINPMNELPIFSSPTDNFDVRYKFVDTDTADNLTNLGSILSLLDDVDPETMDLSTIVFSQRTDGLSGEAFFALDSAGNLTLTNPVNFTEDEMLFQLAFNYSDGTLDSNSDLGFTNGIVLNILVRKNPAPVFQTPDNFDLDENTPDGSDVIFDVDATDEDGETVTYAFKDPNTTFSIDSASGEIRIIDSAALDYETNTELTFTVVATDTAGNDVEQLITVTINNVNEAPVITTGANDFSVDEDALDNVSVGTVASTDEDNSDTAEYSIIGGTGVGVFVIDSVTGEITVPDASVLDFESTPSYTLTVQVEDAAGATDTLELTIAVNDKNDAPELTGATFNLGTVDESDTNQIDAGTADAFYEVRYDGAQFRSQFNDQDNDNLTLTVANAAYLQSLDFIQTVVYDNNTDELIIVFRHYDATQDRTPDLNDQVGLPEALKSSGQAFFLEITATETSSGMLSASDPLWVGVDITLKNTVDFQFIPVASPTNSSLETAGISVNELPTALSQIADGQTFFVEIWGTSFVPRESVTETDDYVNAWLEGFRNVLLDFTFNTTYLTIADASSVVLPFGTGNNSDPPTVNNTTGEIKLFNAYFGIDDAPDDFESIGYNGEYVRFGYLQFTAKQDIDSGGSQIGDLISIDYSGSTSITMEPADTGDTGGKPVNQPLLSLEDLNPAQLTVTAPSVEVVDAYTFTVSSGQANLLIGATGSSVANTQITLQANNTNAIDVSGVIYVTFDDPMNPTSMTIIGSELVFGLNAGEMEPNIPGSGNILDEGNFGFEVQNAQDVDYVNALRETTLRFGAGSTISLTGDPTVSAGATFSTNGIDLEFASGLLDVARYSSRTGITQIGLGGYSVESRANATETGKLTSNAAGTAFTLEIDFFRTLLNDYLTLNTGVSGSPTAETLYNLLTDITVTATYGGGSGVALRGTVYEEDGQVLEDGSGVFVTVNQERTATDANGQVAELPTNTKFATEWDSLWVEVWGNTADAAGIFGGLVDLGYNTDLYTATEIEYASSMSLNRTGTIDDATGTISGLGSQSSNMTLGSDKFVLLGRVKLESIGSDGIDVSLEDDELSESLDITVSSAKLMLTAIGERDATVTVTPNLEVWGVAYDANNDGKVGVQDFSILTQMMGRSSVTDNRKIVDLMDFNNDGKVGVQDFSYFQQNMGRSRVNGDKIIYPEAFTQTWVGSSVDVAGPNTLQEVFDQAVTDWQAALGWEEPIDVKLVVKNFGDSQLGEAQLLELDEDGMPAFGVLTIDDDGAGLGWSTDLEGGPAEGQYDLYTVILHELGHLYGFMSHYSAFAENVVTDFDGNQIFIGADFVAMLDDYAQHLDDIEHNGDVMNAALEPGQRKTISALDVQILETAYASATANSTVYLGGAALTAASVSSETIVDDAPATIITNQPMTFVFNDVVDVETVSGRTGVEAPITPAVFDQLVRNGVRVTTSSSTEVQQQMDEIDSAVATLTIDDSSLLLADAVEDVNYAAIEDDSTNVDDLFADWDLNSDLEG
ncbi:cadherin domain-containing protein [Bremerella sp. JC817]|uniref:cadherin domain-containing protein n=1 Tax=Bremerella sp. JC817 TaxID=3231756 RepID=UPI00345A5357